MITVAIIIPVRIASEDFLISISSKEAIREPVHALFREVEFPQTASAPRTHIFLPDHFFPLPGLPVSVNPGKPLSFSSP